MRRQSQPWTWWVVAIPGWIQRDQQAAIVCVFGHDAFEYFDQTVMGPSRRPGDGLRAYRKAYRTRKPAWRGASTLAK